VVTAVKRSGVVVGIAVVIAASIAATLWIVPAFRPRHGDPNDAAQVALGRQIYANHCASCHGDQLQGQPDWQVRKPDGKLPALPHDAKGAHVASSGRGPVRPYKVWTHSTPRPPGYRSDMPAFGNTLSDGEIWAALAYIKSTWPPDIRERQRRMSAASEQ
jgi:mono/diheme cytochrome c family protein